MRIQRIEEVLPALEGRTDFVVAKKDGYTVIDYLYQDRDTFDDPIRLECRGLKFDSDGRILARPFRKFFNVGEKEQPHEIDLSRPHAVLEKMDGSMIHPALVGGSLVLMTRMGVTDVADKAAKRFLPAYADFMRFCLGDGYTPIFEYTGPENRIVLRYEESALTLLAIRETVSGDYLDRADVRTMVAPFDIPVVGQADFAHANGDVAAVLEHVRALTDQEGYVIHFDDGHMLKMKADDYVLKHRVLSDMGSRKKVIALVLSGMADDVMPLLDETDREGLRTFCGEVNGEVDGLAAMVRDVVSTHGGLDRKTFALEHAKRFEPAPLQGAIFRHLDGDDARAVVVDALARNPDLLNARWAWADKYLAG